MNRDKFWSFVDKSGGEDECWKWTRGRTGEYGIVNIDGTQMQTHRASWTLTRGEIPVGMSICHRCDVPICVNPSHLFLGTHADNMRDMGAKGRWRNVAHVGSKNGFARLNETLVAEMRLLRKSTGLSYQKIAKQYGVSWATAYFAVTGKNWKHVKEAA
jgi:hypothetical protein